MINGKQVYKWIVFLYILLTMVLYLGGFYPFEESIITKSWLSGFPPSLRFFFVSLVLLAFIGVLGGSLFFTLENKGSSKDYAVLLSKM